MFKIIFFTFIKKNLPILIASLFLIFLLFTGCKPTQNKQELKYSEILNQLIDTTRLARLDIYPTKILTSFDRTGGNDDYNNPLRKGPDGWVVLADLKGPGYVSRFWFTGAEDGKHRIRFYFDGKKKPQIETTLEDWCGKQDPFTPPIAAYEPYCWFSFAPIPYKKRLIIMTEDGKSKPQSNPLLFYQINYSTLPSDKTVKSFSLPVSQEHSSQIAEINKVLKNISPGTHVENLKTSNNPITIEPGKTTTVYALTGLGIIRSIEATPDLSVLSSFAKRNSALRDLILRIYWDNSNVPSVEVPLGDFFGSFWKPLRYQSMYFGMTGNTFYTRFPMPFKEGARIEIENQTKTAVPINIVCHTEPLKSWSTNLGYFHANWQRSNPDQVMRPHSVLQTQGKGHYIGCILSTISLDKSWWFLESDEKISVDGESFPSWHGTGLEDYFNAGWYYGNALARSYHGIPFHAPFRTIQYRIHQTDPVAFNSKIHVSFERGPGNKSHGGMENIAFYYLSSPSQAASNLGNSRFRRAPTDPMEQGTIMTEINNMERLGDYQGAADYISSFLEKYAKHPFAPVLEARKVCYEEKKHGFDHVKNKYQEILATETNAIAKTQLQDLLWFHSDKSHAIIGGYCNAKSRIFLNGSLVMEAQNPQKMLFKKLQLKQGKHVIAIQSSWHQHPSWTQTSMKTHYGNINSGKGWKQALNPQGTWWTLDYDDSSWKEYGEWGGRGPPDAPSIWCEPNIFADLQSQALGMTPLMKWPSRQGFIIYRHAFEIP